MWVKGLESKNISKTGIVQNVKIHDFIQRLYCEKAYNDVKNLFHLLKYAKIQCFFVVCWYYAK